MTRRAKGSGTDAAASETPGKRPALTLERLRLIVRDHLKGVTFMWRDTRGEWPVEAILVYPFKASTHTVSVSPDLCTRVAAESVALVTKVQTQASVQQLGTPGEVCTVCDFRPWCQPFWQWQSAEASLTTALTNAYNGFEGNITSLEVLNHYWRFVVSWRNLPVRLLVPQERLPQLRQAQVGTRVRVLGTRLHGNRFQPQAKFDEQSELFLVK